MSNLCTDDLFVTSCCCKIWYAHTSRTALFLLPCLTVVKSCCVVFSGGKKTQPMTPCAVRHNNTAYQEQTSCHCRNGNAYLHECKQGAQEWTLFLFWLINMKWFFVFYKTIIYCLPEMIYTILKTIYRSVALLCLKPNQPDCCK